LSDHLEYYNFLKLLLLMLILVFIYIICVKGYLSEINPAHLNKIQLILTLLQSATEITDLNFPGSNLHRLKGELSEYWSVTVSGKWRIIIQS